MAYFIFLEPYPLYPLPLNKGKGKMYYKRGFASLQHSLIASRVRPFLNILNSPINRVPKRGFAPLLLILPLPLLREGGRGIGFQNPFF